MSRYNFFQRIEREIDFQFEYNKIENIVLNEDIGFETLEKEIERNFLKWKFKTNYASFGELRAELGFTYAQYGYKNLEAKAPISGIDDFILYCEMILNMFYGAVQYKKSGNIDIIRKVVEIIKYDLDKISHKMHITDDNKILIVQKDPAAIAVADIVSPTLADSIIQYNHHLLKGDIKSKQLILKRIADALEPKRAELKQMNRTIETDFFYMVNNMNVRHNNCDKNAPGYTEQFATLSKEQQEGWYDEIYQEGLMAFLILEQAKRTRKIKEFKSGKHIDD